MEILSTESFSELYYIKILLVSSLILLCIAFFFISIYWWLSDKKLEALFACIISGIMLSITGYGLVDIIKEGPVTEYTTKVTDWNEVYDQGYKVDRREGDLVILTKTSR